MTDPTSRCTRRSRSVWLIGGAALVSIVGAILFSSSLSASYPPVIWVRVRALGEMDDQFYASPRGRELEIDWSYASNDTFSFESTVLPSWMPDWSIRRKWVTYRRNGTTADDADSDVSRRRYEWEGGPD